MTATHDSRSFFVGKSGGRLEAILWKPTSVKRAPLAAVVCHPHPLFGGTMHNKVVYQTAKTLDALGIPALRAVFTMAAAANRTTSARRSTFLRLNFPACRSYWQDSVLEPGWVCQPAARIRESPT